MTTDLVAVHGRFAPRGSLGRFALAGAFNSGVFYVTWTISMFLLPDVDIRILWGTFWGLTGVMAHFVHRWYTFDNHKPLAWTLPTAIPVYIGSLVGSSLTIGWLSERYPESDRVDGHSQHDVLGRYHLAVDENFCLPIFLI